MPEPNPNIPENRIVHGMHKANAADGKKAATERPELSKKYDEHLAKLDELEKAGYPADRADEYKQVEKDFTATSDRQDELDGQELANKHDTFRTFWGHAEKNGMSKKHYHLWLKDFDREKANGSLPGSEEDSIFRKATAHMAIWRRHNT